MKGKTSISDANISSNYVRLIALELGLTLKDLPKLLAFTNLESNNFLQAEQFISTEQLIQVFQNIIKIGHDDEFGLKLGKRLIPTTHGAMGFLVNSCPNLFVALKSLQHFLPTRIGFAEIDLSYTKDHILCTLDFNIEMNEAIFRIISEACLVIFFQCAECITGRPIHEATISFRHAIPDYYEAQYRQYFCSPSKFSQEKIQVKLPLSLCHIANASANQETFLLAKQQCENMLSRLQPTQFSYSYQIRKIMLNNQLNDCTEEHIASNLFMSKQTLARHLANEKTSFREIRESILSEQSIQYLEQTNLSIEVIANLLNYHDSSNFRRAFKRWFHITPQAYRLQHHQSITHH